MSNCNFSIPNVSFMSHAFMLSIYWNALLILTDSIQHVIPVQVLSKAQDTGPLKPGRSTSRGQTIIKNKILKF